MNIDVVCTPNEIVMTKKNNCEEVRGDIVFQGKQFTNETQNLFHSVRLLRGRVILNNAGLQVLHAFKGVWDIIIEDPLDKDYKWKRDSELFD